MFCKLLLQGQEHRYIKKVFVKQRNSITKRDLPDKNRILRSMSTSLTRQSF